MKYKNYFIEHFQDGFIVLFCGDEVYFDTVQEAKDFIDGL